jgi:hypothetical protein
MYVARPPFETFEDDPQLLTAYAEQVYNMRLSRGFGSWSKLKLLPRGRQTAQIPPI